MNLRMNKAGGVHAEFLEPDRIKRLTFLFVNKQNNLSFSDKLKRNQSVASLLRGGCPDVEERPF
jgi:hypothetical protein